MPADEDLDWFALEDFRPGIWSSTIGGGGGEHAPDGAAQAQGTTGCVAFPNGQLGPGPRLTSSITSPAIEATKNSIWNSGGGQARHISIGNVGVISAVESTLDCLKLATSDCVVIPLQYYFNTAASNYELRGKAVILKRDPGTNVTIGTRTGSSAHALNTSFRFAGMPIAQLYSVSSAGTTPAVGNVNPIVATNMMEDNQQTTGYLGFGFALPDPASTSTDSLASMGVRGPLMMTHQSRLVYLNSRAWNFFASQTYAHNLDSILYGSVYDILSSGTEFLPDNLLSGFGAGHSVNANELLLIRHDNGAVVITGALETPTVTSYPGVTSVQGASNYGCMTPLGFVYGSRFGIHAWNGSDSSQNISPQLDGWFWRPLVEENVAETAPFGLEDSSYIKEDFCGGFTYCEPYIFAPNNWIYDIRIQSWFRIDRQTYADWSGTNSTNYIPYAYYSASSRYPYVYAVISGGPGDSADVGFRICDIWDCTLQTRDYTWVSHPIRRTRSRINNLREMIVVAKGQGTVKVTLTDIDGREHSERVDLRDTGKLEHFRFTPAARVLDMEVTIEADSGNAAVGAPIIDRILFGFARGTYYG